MCSIRFTLQNPIPLYTWKMRLIQTGMELMMRTSFGSVSVQRGMQHCESISDLLIRIKKTEKLILGWAFFVFLRSG
jgi:hypothetical protein